MNPLTPAEMRELHKRTTPGPWIAKVMEGHYTDQIESNHPDLKDKWPERYVTSFDGPGDHWEANRNFLLAAHNSMPALLDRIEELERVEAERLAERDKHDVEMIVVGMEHAMRVVAEDIERIKREHAEASAALPPQGETAKPGSKEGA